MTVYAGPAEDARVPVLRSIARSISAPFPSAAEDLRNIADALEQVDEQMPGIAAEIRSEITEVVYRELGDMVNRDYLIDALMSAIAPRVSPTGQ